MRVRALPGAKAVLVSVGAVDLYMVCRLSLSHRILFLIPDGNVAKDETAHLPAICQLTSWNSMKVYVYNSDAKKAGGRPFQSSTVWWKERRRVTGLG